MRTGGKQLALCSPFPSGTPGTPSPPQTTPAGMAGPRGAIRRISWVGRVLREDFRARDTSTSKTPIPRQATESPGLCLASRGHCRPQHVKLPQAPVPLTSDLSFRNPVDRLFSTNNPRGRVTSKTTTFGLLVISVFAFLEFFLTTFPSEIYFGVVFCKFLQ